MFDAYTVKKMLPRAVIAIIGIQISWYVFVALIQIVNLIAYSLEGLIYAPFGGADKLSLANILGQTTGGNGLFFAGLVAGGAVAVGAAVSLGGVVALAISAILALFIGFILLMIRKVVIVFLLILSPLALVAWILPGTEKYWKLWWESFFKLLMLYPMIIGTVAMGRVFAWTASAQDGQVVVVGNVGQVIIILVGCFGPFFLIPKLFTLAGHAFANITGAVNNRQKGAFDRLRNYRQGKQKQNWENLKAGQRYKGGNALSRRLNTGFQTASLAGAGGATLDFAKRRDRMQVERNKRDFNNASKIMQESEAFGAIKNDDDKLWALINHADGSEDDIRRELAARAPGRFQDPKELDRAVAQVMAAKREGGSSRALQIAATRAQFSTGTGYNYARDAEGNLTYNDDALSTVMRVAGDDGALVGQIWGEGKAAGVQSGRQDTFGGGFAYAMQVKDRLRQSEAEDARLRSQGWSDHQIATRTGRYTMQDAHKDLQRDSLRSNAAGIFTSKKEGVHQLATLMNDDLDTALQGGDTDAAMKLFAGNSGRLEAAGQLAPQNADVAAEDFWEQTIDVASLPEATKKMLQRKTAWDVPEGTPIEYDESITTLTKREADKRMRVTNKDYNARHYEMYTGSLRSAEAEMAAAQAQQQQQQQTQQGLGGNVGQPPQVPGL